MNADEKYDQLQKAKTFIETKSAGEKPTIGLILGSGLGAYADSLDDSVVIPYSDIPHFPQSTVKGHSGQLVIGKKHGKTCIAMQGRVHYYEGYTPTEVVFPARVMILLGVSTLVVTNSAGGLTHPPGSLMMIKDHLNLFPEHPLHGPNDERLGPRFPDMTEVYTKSLRDIATSSAKELGLTLEQGIYAGLSGPAYETPAEVRMLKTLGADAVGMSTVPEIIAARHMGAKILGISCITNPAAGLSDNPLTHKEVTETATNMRSSFISLIDHIISKL